MTDYNTYKLSRKETATYLIAVILFALCVGEVFYQSLFFSIIIMPLGIPCVKVYERYLAEKRKRALAESFRDLLYSLSSSFSTRRQMPEALAEGLESMRLIYPEDAPIIQELLDMNKRMFSNRENERDILKDFAARSHNEDIRNFVDAYLICRTSGGDMEKLIVKASDVIIDKMEIQKEIQLITAQKRLESKILLIIPIGILLFLQLFSPGYTAALYETMAGRLIMTVALGLTALAYLWSIKLTIIKI